MTEEAGYELEVGLSGPESPAPDTSTPAEPAIPAEDIVELRIKDEEYRVPKEEFQAFADRLGWGVDELTEAIQIGRDGRNVYRTIAEQKEELRRAWENLHERGQHAPPATPEGPAPTPSPSGGFRPRPPAEDIPGQVQWLGDMMEQLAPALGRLPTIEEVVNRSASTAAERERQLEVAAERSAAHAAYSQVAENWKKEGYDLPPLNQLEDVLRQIPLSDDIRLTWQEIFDKVGWMVAGQRNARQARRRAVLDSQTPRGVGPSLSGHRPSPGGGAPAPSAAPSMGDGPKSLDQLEAEGKALERQLQGITVEDVAGQLSRR